MVDMASYTGFGGRGTIKMIFYHHKSVLEAIASEILAISAQPHRALWPDVGWQKVWYLTLDVHVSTIVMCMFSFVDFWAMRRSGMPLGAADSDR